MATTSGLENARNSLLRYYQQWQTLTETEGDAIRGSNWRQVDQLQATKSRLQKLILTASHTLRAEAEAHGVDLSGIEKEFCGLVEQLIRLETRNREEIATRREQVESDLAFVESSRQHLRRVQRAYAPGRDARWESYS